MGLSEHWRFKTPKPTFIINFPMTIDIKHHNLVLSHPFRVHTQISYSWLYHIIPMLHPYLHNFSFKQIRIWESEGKTKTRRKPLHNKAHEGYKRQAGHCCEGCLEKVSDKTSLQGHMKWTIYIYIPDICISCSCIHLTLHDTCVYEMNSHMFMGKILNIAS